MTITGLKATPSDRRQIKVSTKKKEYSICYRANEFEHNNRPL